MKRWQISGAFVMTASVIFASGCAATPAPPTPADSVAALSVVVIGDSIPYNAPEDCPGCTAFVDSYAAALTESTGDIHTVVNRSRHDGARTADILEEVQSGSLDTVLSAADIVIVSAGYNDQPPYGQGSCYDSAINLDTAEGAAEALIATTAECIAIHTATAGADLAGVLEGVRATAPDASILVLAAYNAWTGWPDFEALGAETAGAASATVAASLDSWRSVVCDESQEVGGDCVDLLTAFNGADGLTPAGDLLAADYTHPSQRGNDLIRDILLQL